MKRIVTFSIVIAGLLGLSSAARADQGGLRAKVPFSFAVGDKIFPAGAYVIQRDGGFIRFRSLEGANGAFVIQMRGSTSADGRSRLLFKENHGQYFLRSIVTPSAADSVDFAKSKLEKRSEESSTYSIDAMNSSR